MSISPATMPSCGKPMATIYGNDSVAFGETGTFRGLGLNEAQNITCGTVEKIEKMKSDWGSTFNVQRSAADKLNNAVRGQALIVLGKRSLACSAHEQAATVLGTRRSTDSAFHISGYTKTTGLTNLSLTMSNTCSPTSWVSAYQPPLAFGPLKELGSVQSAMSHR